MGYDFRQFMSNFRRAQDSKSFVERTARWFFGYEWVRPGFGVVVTPQSDGVEVAVDLGALGLTDPGDEQVKADSGDPTAGYLDDKCQNSVEVSATDHALQLVGDIAGGGSGSDAHAFYGMGSDGSSRGFHGFDEITVVTAVAFDSESGDFTYTDRTVRVWAPGEESDATAFAHADEDGVDEPEGEDDEEEDPDDDAPIDPGAVGGMLFWLKADAITSLDNGDPVASWPDSSGNGHAFAQSSGALRPLWVEAQLNGLPAVVFNSAKWLINTDSGVLGTFNADAFTLYGLLTNSDVGNAMIGINDYDATDSYFYLAPRASGIGLYWSCNSGVWPTGSSDIGSSPAVVCVSYDGSTLLCQANDDTAHSVGGATAGAGYDIDQITVGGVVRGMNPGGVAMWSGSLVEVLAYGGAHDESTRLAVLDYLKNRGGLS